MRALMSVSRVAAASAIMDSLSSIMEAVNSSQSASS